MRERILRQESATVIVVANYDDGANWARKNRRFARRASLPLMLPHENQRPVPI